MTPTIFTNYRYSPALHFNHSQAYRSHSPMPMVLAQYGNLNAQGLPNREPMNHLLNAPPRRSQGLNVLA